MFLFSRKALGFRNPDTNEIVYVRQGDVTEVPDWVAHDPLYKWAKAEGSIDVIEKQIQTVVSKAEIDLSEPTNKKTTKSTRKSEPKE